MKAPLRVLLSTLLLFPLLHTTPVHGAETHGDTSNLVGAWHTVSIDGDALFFVVHGIEVDLRADGTFDAHIRFTDGETESKTGTYRVKGDQIALRVPSLHAREHATYSIVDHKLVFHDPSFDITLKLARGKAKDESGDDLF